MTGNSESESARGICGTWQQEQVSQKLVARFVAFVYSIDEADGHSMVRTRKQ
jgi:hypothetical protein